MDEEIKKIYNDLDVLFRGEFNEGWRLTAKNEGRLEKLLKKIHHKLWGWFFDKVILRHFYRGQMFMYDSIMRDLENYKKGKIDDRHIKSLKSFMEREPKQLLK